MTDHLLYQVTLASGQIVTRPEEWGEDESRAADDDYYRPIFSEDGRLLTVAAEDERQETTPA